MGIFRCSRITSRRSFARLTSAAPPDPGSGRESGPRSSSAVPVPVRGDGRIERTPRRRRVADRVATVVVRTGGFAVVASLAGILFFLVGEIVPLFQAAQVRFANEQALATDPRARQGVGAVLADPHRTHVATLETDGVVRIHALDPEGQQVAVPVPTAGERLLSVQGIPEENAFVALGSDGRILRVAVRWIVSFVGRERKVRAIVSDPQWVDLGVPGSSVTAYALRAGERRSTAVGATADGSLVVVRTEISSNDFTGERSESTQRLVLSAPSGVTHLEIDPAQRHLYAAAAQGRIAWWPIDVAAGIDAPLTSDPGPDVTALDLLVGGRALVVGRADGSIAVWTLVQRGRAHRDLRPIHELESLSNAVVALAPAQRGRSFLAIGEKGEARLYHSTSERTLWRGALPLASAVRDLVYAPKGDGAYVLFRATLLPIEIDNPHPEAGLGAFFAKVWYEGASQPEHVWQSTGGSDEFEPKLGLVPLVFGTLKGTAYALVFAIPLGILGAIYTSQFLDPRYQRVVKPTVELMASLPSVVLGFVAGLWLAPRLEAAFPGLVLALIALPPAMLGSGWLWSSLPRHVQGRFAAGSEVIFQAGFLLAVLWLCLELSDPLERWLFGQSFSGWLYTRTGLGYDQRNAIVAGIAMGFAVIPILFSIAEDAISNVPRSLTAASLALGATRWQTVVRVVLPSASPGLFAAVMIGFGRAVGETMIVLMATGNTPILDVSPFVGFRTLSANIAVEIPEAPHGGTLYRTLFISSLLLFVLTFVINTAAELVRERMRRRYAGG